MFADRPFWNEVVEKRRSDAYLASWRRPTMWLDRAYLHYRAADLVYVAAEAAAIRNWQRLLRELEQPDKVTLDARTLEGEELEDFRDERLQAEYLLLSGYALECLLKGYLLVVVPDLVTLSTRTDSLVANHKLVQLAKDCGMQLSAEESQLLEVMERHIVWGKYPAPLHVRDMPSPIDADDQRAKSLTIQNAFHEQKLKRLVDQLFYRAARLLVPESPQP